MKSAIALIVLASMSAPVQETTKLEWKPKVGEVIALKFSMGMNMGGDINVSFLVKSKTTKIANGEVTSESEMSGFTLMFNGQEMDMGGQGGPEMEGKTVMVQKLNGMIVSDTSAEAMGGERMARMNAFHRPDKAMKIGDSWEHEWKADSAKGLQNSKARWTLKAYEPKNGVNCWKVDYVYAEMDTPNGISVNGSLWLNAADGQLEFTKYDFQNVSFQDGMPPASGTGQVTRQR